MADGLRRGGTAVGAAAAPFPGAVACFEADLLHQPADGLVVEAERRDEFAVDGVVAADAADLVGMTAAIKARLKALLSVGNKA